MNRLSLDRRTQAIGCLVEGNSIRSTERMTGIHRDTIMRLLVEVGTACARLTDERMSDLPCQRIQVDEIWAYVGEKQRQVTPEDDRSRVGDMWTFVALDPNTKLVPAYRIGKRDMPTAKVFMADLSDRLANRVQLSSDALRAYVDATEEAFGADVDYGQLVKIYDAEPIGPGRYSPPKGVAAKRHTMMGAPDPRRSREAGGRPIAATHGPVIETNARRPKVRSPDCKGRCPNHPKDGARRDEIDGESHNADGFRRWFEAA